MYCRQLSSMSESIAQRVDVAVDLQQKANRVLTHILGAQYTLCEPHSFMPPLLSIHLKNETSGVASNYRD